MGVSHVLGRLDTLFAACIYDFIILGRKCCGCCWMR